MENESSIKLIYELTRKPEVIIYSYNEFVCVPAEEFSENMN